MGLQRQGRRRGRMVSAAGDSHGNTAGFIVVGETFAPPPKHRRYPGQALPAILLQDLRGPRFALVEGSFAPPLAQGLRPALFHRSPMASSLLRRRVGRRQNKSRHPSRGTIGGVDGPGAIAQIDKRHGADATGVRLEGFARGPSGESEVVGRKGSSTPPIPGTGYVLETKEHFHGFEAWGFGLASGGRKHRDGPPPDGRRRGSELQIGGTSGPNRN